MIAVNPSALPEREPIPSPVGAGAELKKLSGQSIPIPRGLEPRLQQRFRQMVAEALHVSEGIAAGIRALPGIATSFASTQGAWRFLNNERVRLPDLAEPLISCGSQALSRSSDRYGLLVHDWSRLAYKKHRRKRDRAVLKNKKDLGYELETALLVSDQDGRPLAPLSQSLRAADGIHSTRSPRIEPLGKSPLDRLTESLQLAERLDLSRPLVHIIDREADSVAHYRQWSQEGMRFLVRADQERVVRHQGREQKLPQLLKQLLTQKAFSYCGEVEIQGRPGQQWVAETRVVLDRPAKHRVREIPGPALELRLVVSQVRSAQGKLLAQWLLLTNLEEAVDAATVALWYYWRWKIESYFKLLKSAGHQVEHWLQQSAAALARRLAVTAMACVLVWQLARNPQPEAQPVRQLLVRLSGRQMKRRKPFTEPALLAGLWVLLAMLEALEHYSLEELQQAAQLVIPGLRRSRSP
jgi:hypothetical protein